MAKEKFKDTCIQEEAKETHTHTHKKAKWSAIQNRCDYHFIFFLFNSMPFFNFIELLS